MDKDINTLKEELKKGKKVTSEDLKKITKPKIERLKE